MHEHFDVDGTPTGTTVITREAEWSDLDRRRASELSEYEASLCPCGCGQPISEAGDPQRAFQVDQFVCRARRALDRIERDAKQKAETTKQPDDWADGLQFFISDSFVVDPKEGPRD